MGKKRHNLDKEDPGNWVSEGLNIYQGLCFAHAFGPINNPMFPGIVMPIWQMRELRLTRPPAHTRLISHFHPSSMASVRGEWTWVPGLLRGCSAIQEAERFLRSHSRACDQMQLDSWDLLDLRTACFGMPKNFPLVENAKWARFPYTPHAV